MTCDLCGLPDLHNGNGDGIGSCDCPRCRCGAARSSVFCVCPLDGDDGDDWGDYPLQGTYPGSGIYE
jgi:hypothetical protein